MISYLKKKIVPGLNDRVAQWIRHQTSNLGVAGSIPVTIYLL